MKTKMFASLALIAVMASPAAAATVRQHHNAMAPHARSYEPIYGSELQPGQAWQDSDVVVSGNRIVGQDPDPNVRLELRRDPVADY